MWSRVGLLFRNSFKSLAWQSKGDGHRRKRESREWEETFALWVFAAHFSGLAFNHCSPLKANRCCKHHQLCPLTPSLPPRLYLLICTFINTWKLIAANVYLLHIVAFPECCQWLLMCCSLWSTRLWTSHSLSSTLLCLLAWMEGNLASGLKATWIKWRAAEMFRKKGATSYIKSTNIKHFTKQCWLNRLKLYVPKYWSWCLELRSWIQSTDGKWTPFIPPTGSGVKGKW